MINQYDPEKVIDIQEYHSPLFYPLELCGLTRTLPIIPADSSLWLVGNESLCFGCDVEFTHIVARELALRLRSFQFDYIVCPETKSLSLAYEISRILGLQRFIIVRKTVRKGVSIAFSEPVTSISSINAAEPQLLYLNASSAKEIEDRKVVLMDDTISTGGTMSALINLMGKAKAKVEALAAIWLEGASYYQDLSSFIISDRLVFLDSLPLYGTGDQYRMMLQEKERVIRQHQSLSNLHLHGAFHPMGLPSSKENRASSHILC